MARSGSVPQASTGAVQPERPIPSRFGTLPPATDVREEQLGGRAQRARTEQMVVIPQTSADGDATGVYRVHKDDGATYVVNLRDPECGCPDHQQRENRCKHLRRVAMAVNETALPVPGEHAGQYFGTALREMEAHARRERAHIEQVIGNSRAGGAAAIRTYTRFIAVLEQARAAFRENDDATEGR